MKKTLAVAAAALLATSSCDLFHSATLEVRPGGELTEVSDWEWPWGSGEHVAVNNVLIDSAGLAGIEIEVIMPGEPAFMLTATDFLERSGGFGSLPTVEEDIRVPDEGTATVFVKLRQAGVVVADGFMSWTLHSGVTSWQIWFERAPVSLDMRDPRHTSNKDASPPCDPPQCHQIRRIEIDEAARNYPDEALWLTLYRWPIGV